MTHEERRRLIEAPLCIRTVGSNARGAAGMMTLSSKAGDQMMRNAQELVITPQDLQLFLYEADEKDIKRWKDAAEKRRVADERRSEILRLRKNRVMARSRAALQARLARRSDV